jgi:hypothetical protein
MLDMGFGHIERRICKTILNWMGKRRIERSITLNFNIICKIAIKLLEKSKGKLTKGYAN